MQIIYLYILNSCNGLFSLKKQIIRVVKMNLTLVLPGDRLKM